MFSLFSKSSKGVAKNGSDDTVHKRIFSGSQGTLNTDREEIPCLSPYKNNQFEVRSSVSVNTNNSENKKYKKEKKKSRSRNFRGLFNSDCEDEINSVVSDNPQLYHRSSSMVSSSSPWLSYQDFHLFLDYHLQLTFASELNIYKWCMTYSCFFFFLNFTIWLFA